VVTTYEQGALKAGHIREAAGMKESWFYRLLKERRDAAGTSSPA
jgi:predicted DNA-binding transcriptional regulator AlpA